MDGVWEKPHMEQIATILVNSKGNLLEIFGVALWWFQYWVYPILTNKHKKMNLIETEKHVNIEYVKK